MVVIAIAIVIVNPKQPSEPEREYSAPIPHKCLQPHTYPILSLPRPSHGASPLTCKGMHNGGIRGILRA